MLVNIMNATEKFLFEKYGPLMSLVDLAKVLNRSPEGLRVTLGSKNELSQELKPAKHRIGRRVLFKTELVARFISAPEEQ